MCSASILMRVCFFLYAEPSLLPLHYITPWFFKVNRYFCPSLLQHVPQVFWTCLIVNALPCKNTCARMTSRSLCSISAVLIAIQRTFRGQFGCICAIVRFICAYMLIISACDTVFLKHICDRLLFFIFMETLILTFAVFIMHTKGVYTTRCTYIEDIGRNYDSPTDLPNNRRLLEDGS